LDGGSSGHESGLQKDSEVYSPRNKRQRLVVTPVLGGSVGRGRTLANGA
jgi:hypothetical protein